MTLTFEQVNALALWAAENGRCWKSALRHAWMTGNYNGFEKSNLLQQIRNNFGPSWLVKYSLGE